MSNRPLAACAAVLLLAFATAPLAGAATATATIDLPGKAKWNRVTSLGLVLVGTDDALMLVNGETGQVQWKRDDIKKTLPYNVREVDGSPFILVNDWSGAMAARVSAQGLDFATGATVFRTEPEQGQSLGLYPVPGGQQLLNISQLYQEGSGTYATLFETATGKKLWRTKIAGMMGFTLHPAETGAFIVTRHDLSAHQDPVLDAGTPSLPFPACTLSPLPARFGPSVTTVSLPIPNRPPHRRVPPPRCPRRIAHPASQAHARLLRPRSAPPHPRPAGAHASARRTPKAPRPRPPAHWLPHARHRQPRRTLRRGRTIGSQRHPR